MNKSELIESQINKLEEKFKDSGQDLSSYLDGLLYQRYLTYWDYIHLDTLLSIQVPKTHFPDEEIFIMYHQITELYFKLILHEEKQLVEDESQELDFFVDKISRKGFIAVGDYIFKVGNVWKEKDGPGFNDIDEIYIRVGAEGDSKTGKKKKKKSARALRKKVTGK